MKSKKFATVIRNIRSTGRRDSGGLPGNILVNCPAGEDPKPEHWINNREIRNGLLGAGFHPRTPVSMLVGATIRGTRIEIEQSDLPVDGSGFKYMVNGREVTYKQPGVHNVNCELDFSSLPAEKQFQLADLSIKYARQTAVAATASTSSQDTPEEVEDLTEVDANQPAAQGQPAAQVDLNVEAGG